LPEPVSTERKQAVSRATIDALENAIESKAVYEKMHERIRRTHGLDEEFSKQCIDYLWRRRRFLLWLLQATGLRPGEMMRLSAKDLEDAIRSEKNAVGILSIPTLKRRRVDPPKRPFVLFGSQIEQLRRYLAGRREWLDACAKHTGRLCISNALFLGTSPGGYGLGISKSALEKDFAQLCSDAGLRDQQTCFSMFRHRFITQEIRLLIKEFKLKNGRSVVQSDYHALLERVRVKTGHADVRSLFHYLSLAENDDGLFDGVGAFEEQRARTALAKDSLEEIQRDFALGLLGSKELLLKLAGITQSLGRLGDGVAN
jgi:integrase